jgi:4-hydroxy-2-oxoheptanedioate aldolase
MSEAKYAMRRSRCLAKMRKGETAVCIKVNLADPRVIELAGLIGFDCVWTCMEHVPNSLDAIENQIRASKMFDMDIVVRVRRGSYSDLILPLEADATAIMIPHVMNLQDAKQIVYYTKFHPIGRRPWDGGNADGLFCLLSGKEYHEQANRERFNILQVEDPEVLDDMEEIAKLPGVDMIFFGPGDFSQGIGAPGVWDHPRLLETRRRVAEAARAHGKFAGTVGSPANLDELIALGYRFISIGADVVGLAQYCQSLMAEFTKRPAPVSSSIYGGKTK